MTRLLVFVTGLLLCSAAMAEETVVEKVMREQDGKIPRAAMVKAFDYFAANAEKIQNKNFVTIVNFDRPSTEKRFHVIDMKTGEVADYYVAHGKNSGENFATNFSNEPGSNKSSLGIYLSAEDYIGKHGLSMRMDGMEPTCSNIRKRDIVMHGAEYVSEAYAKKNGRMGRSEGCLALEQPLVAGMVKKLEGKSVILVWRSEPTKEAKASGTADERR